MIGPLPQRDDGQRREIRLFNWQHVKSLSQCTKLDMIRAEMMSLRDEPPEELFAKWSLLDTGVCLALLTVFLVSRCLWITTNPESSTYWEEAYRWVAVEQLSTDAKLPLSEYQADQYQGGSLIVIALAAALRSIGVDSFIALKVVALSFSGATLIALYLIGRIFFGRVVAVLSGLIFLLGPPLVAFWGVVAMGFHSESVLLSLCVVGIFLALVEGVWFGPRAWLCFGFASGLAVWFTPTAGITVVACVVAWPWLAQRPKISSLAIATVGLCFGLAPWLAYNLTHDFAGLDRILEVFGARPSADFWRSQGLGMRAVDLFLVAPTQGLLDPGGDLSRPWPAFALFAGVWIPASVALAAAMARAVRVMRIGRAERDVGARREFVFLVFAVVFSAALLTSRFIFHFDPTPIVYRLIVPLAVFLILPIAVSTARGLGAGGARGRWSAIGCATALSSLCVATVSFALWHVEPGTPLSLRTGYVVWGRLLYNKYTSDIGAAVEVANRIATETERDNVLRGIGWGMRHVHERREVSDLARALDQISEADRKMVVSGLIWALDRRRDEVAAELLRAEDPELRQTLAHLETLSKWIESRERRAPPGEAMMHE